MRSGFRVIDDELGWPSVERSAPWDVIQVSYGHRSDWALRLELVRGEVLRHVAFISPVSFRVQDEREMVDYWNDWKGAAFGTFVTVARSPYLDGLTKGGVTGMIDPLTHYLVLAQNTCVEVIGGPRTRIVLGAEGTTHDVRTFEPGYEPKA